MADVVANTGIFSNTTLHVDDTAATAGRWC